MQETRCSFQRTCPIIRPHDIHVLVGGLMFYHGFFLLFLSATLRNWVQFENACPKSGVSPPPTNRGPKTTYFSRCPNLTATLTGNMVYISGKVSGKLQEVSHIISKRHELWSTNGFKLKVSFHPPSVNSAFRFIARLRRRRSVNRTQPNFVKRWTVGRANNLP